VRRGPEVNRSLNAFITWVLNVTPWAGRLGNPFRY